MQVAALLATLLCSTALGQNAQVPLKDIAQGWFDKAKSYIPSTDSIPDPIEAGAAAIAGQQVQKVNIRNFERLLAPKSEGPEEWLIYTTGGNKTCFGRCGNADLAWNESVPILAALPQSGSSTLRLGKIDCERENVLCSAWGIACPGAAHFLVPQKSSESQLTPARFTNFNVSTVGPQDIITLASAAPNSKIMNITPYEGILHPIDGMLAKAGLQQYLGYLINFLGSTPSWVIMLTISFFSRQFMGSRMTGRAGPSAQQPAGAAPAAPVAAQRTAAPASAGKGGKKRR
ncbi:hypothetical protein LTR05_002431 [Lithohypha guttulata]|uniref:Uncharacterized protein n=1 Tax=Lithohypha guttulata TaxID=1690604 RepID=A0AAN7YIX5_9EURO|nr:hypothetical protein LTR05_002431 [Lithohypha guttulata]